MSDDQAVAAPRKKGKLGKVAMIGAGALLLVGGGVAAGLYASGMGVGGAHPVEDPNRPKLVLKDGTEAVAPMTEGAPLDPRKYKATYYNLEQNFTSNLRDSDGIMQVGLGVSTFYDSRVIDALKANEIPVRSAILMTLADQDAFVIATPEGKRALQKQLTDAVNAVLKAKTGYGGVDNVYFTNFIVQ
ncbi:MAG TPA: flagellar basal body-associated FliL family protein [Sphingomonadaceae bacterium]|nr:flagellar basal body-associated FliL family protein [Sphingomonadaceae bacterium]